LVSAARTGKRETQKARLRSKLTIYQWLQRGKHGLVTAHRASPRSLTQRSYRGGLANILNPTPNAIPVLIPAPTPIVVVEQDIQYRSYRVFSRNGRNFHAWKAGKYPFPCDRVARDNDDIVNAITHHYCYGTGGYDNSLLEEVLIRPLVGGHSRLKRVLDLGCGSGLFVAEVAHSFPHATVVGVDLVEGQDT
jgi:hypothetical protein